MAKLSDLLEGKTFESSENLGKKRPETQPIEGGFKATSQDILREVAPLNGGKLTQMLQQRETPEVDIPGAFDSFEALSSIPNPKQVPKLPGPFENFETLRKTPQDLQYDFVDRQVEADRQKKFDTVARKQTQKDARKELDVIQEQLRQVQMKKNKTSEDYQNIERLKTEFANTQAIGNPTGRGIIEGLPFGDKLTGNMDKLTNTNQQLIDEARQTPEFKKGQIATKLGTQVALYSTVGTALRGTSFVKGLASKLGTGKVAEFTAGQIADLFVDAAIQTPQEVLRGETIEKIGMNRLLDIGINLGIGAGGEFIKSLKSADPIAFESAVKKLSPEDAKAVRDTLGVDTRVDLSPQTKAFTPKVDERPLINRIDPTDTGRTVEIYGEPYKLIGSEGNNYKAIDAMGDETFVPKAIVDKISTVTPSKEAELLLKSEADKALFELDSSIKGDREGFLRSENIDSNFQRGDEGDFFSGQPSFKTPLVEELLKSDYSTSYADLKKKLTNIKSGATPTVTEKRIIEVLENQIKQTSQSQPARITDNLSTTVGKPVSKTPLSDALRQQEVPAQAARIEGPQINENTLISDMPTIAKGEPIDTKSLITTELPKKVKQSTREKFDRAYQEIVGKYDFLGKVSDKARVQSSNLNRTLGSIEHNVVGNQTNMLGENIGKSVTDIFENVKNEDKADLFEYIFHKHNIDRAFEGKPVFGESIDSEFSKDFVKNFEANNPNAVQTQQEITNYFKNILNEWAVPSGLTSKDTAELLNNIYKNYVPTFRAKNFPKGMGQGNQTVAQILKKAKGSEDKLLPIDQMMIMQTDRVIKNARKNEMLNTLADAFENGEGNVAKRVFEIKGGEKEVLDDVLDVGRHLEAEPIAQGNDYLINYYKNGKPMQMRVDKVTYEAFKPQNFDNMVNKGAQVFKKYATQPFKSLITEYNPGFSVANVLRDIPTALTFSDNALKMTAKVPEAMKEILTNGEKFKQFKALGGTREGLIGAGKEFKVPTLNDKTMLQKIGKQANKANPFKYISDVNKFTETVPRFSEYLAVLEKTGDPALAVYKSADLTTDFAKHGNSTKLLDSFVPYLNPQVQGINKFVRSTAKNPIKTAMGAGAAITVPTIILDQINKDDEAYNSLSPREKNLYFQIPYEDKNGNRQFVRIPKSRELGVAFSSIYDWAARASRGERVTGEEIKQTIDENFGVGITPLWEPAAKAWSQIKDPDAYETNYWGGLIVPESQRNYSPGEQYDLNSSGIAKAIGQKFDLSPFVVDYLIRSYTGVAGQFVQPIGADRKKDFLDPLTKRFKTDPVYKSDATNKFYTLLDKSTKEANDYNRKNDLVTSGPENIVTPLEQKASDLRKVAKQMSDIRKEQKLLQVEKGNEEKLRALQDAINKLAEEAVRSSK